MLIIFGTRRVRRNLAVVLMMCQRCHTPCAQTVLKVSSWFTLFFIPIVPLGSSYRTVCSMCAGAVKIDKLQAERLQRSAAEQRAQAPTMTADGSITASAPFLGSEEGGTGTQRVWPNPAPRTALTAGGHGGSGRIVIRPDDLDPTA